MVIFFGLTCNQTIEQSLGFLPIPSFIVWFFHFCAKKCVFLTSGLHGAGSGARQVRQQKAWLATGCSDRAELLRHGDEERGTGERRILQKNAFLSAKMEKPRNKTGHRNEAQTLLYRLVTRDAKEYDHIFLLLPYEVAEVGKKWQFCRKSHF